jgi:disulfide bond formation protein DsbB
LARARSSFHHGRPAGIDPRDVPWIVTALSFAALCIAWLVQFGFGYAPCELCIWTRYGYWGVILLGLISMWFSRQAKVRKFWLTLTGIGLLAVLGISVFQVGVEQGWWHGTEACTGVSTAGMTAEQMLDAINNAPVVRCDQPAFLILGISMAGYNILYVLMLAWFTFWGASRRTHR